MKKILLLFLIISIRGASQITYQTLRHPDRQKTPYIVYKDGDTAFFYTYIKYKLYTQEELNVIMEWKGYMVASIAEGYLEYAVYRVKQKPIILTEGHYEKEIAIKDTMSRYVFTFNSLGWKIIYDSNGRVINK